MVFIEACYNCVDIDVYFILFPRRGVHTVLAALTLVCLILLRVCCSLCMLLLFA